MNQCFPRRRNGGEIDDEEGNIKYKYTSTIEGTWEIKKGNLSLHYNISTLEVTLRKKDVEFDWQYVIADSCGSSSIFEDGYEQDQFIKKLKKQLQRSDKKTI